MTAAIATAPRTAPAPIISTDRLRIGITGAPDSGKTTLAYKLAGELAHHPTVVSTDSYQHLGWSESSAKVAEVLSGMVNDHAWSGIVEGVALPRALRKMLRAAPTVRPLDRLIILQGIYRADGSRGVEDDLPKGQRSMAKGLLTTLTGPIDEDVPGSPRLIDALRDLGVEIEWRS